MKKIALLTSGGDAPGMNAAIRSVVRTARFKNMEVHGVFRGYAGLLEGDMHLLTARDAGGIVHHGGTVLRTARCARFREKAAQMEAVDILKKHDIDGLVVIGGDGSMAGAASLSALGISTVTIPATIDNDMNGTEETIGFDTAVNTVVEAARRIRDTASSHDRAALIEVMGRHSGYIAVYAGLAAGAEYILIPEEPFNRDALARDLMAQAEKGRTNSLIICAEGAADGNELGRWLDAHTGIDVCTTILGYIQRGGAPSARDAILGAILGSAAVEALEKGCRHHLVGMHAGHVRLISYDDAEKEKRKLETGLFRLADVLGTQA